MKHNHYYAKVVILFYFVGAIASTTVDLQCRPLKESPDVCLVTKKGNFQNAQVTIVSNKASEVKHIKVVRVDLGHVPLAVSFRSFRKLEAVTFESCGIWSLDGMKSLKNVQQIFLNRNNITQVPDGKFNHQVVYIEAQFNRMENVSRNAFKNLKNLYWLDLSNNRIKKLPRKVFMHNNVLTSLNLNNNRLKNIRQVFRHQENLRFLRLAQNRIGRIPKDAFSSLKVLRELDLSSNKITHVDPNAFDSCQTLTLLNLSKNLLKILHLTIPSKSLSFLYLMDNAFANLTIDYKEKPTRLVLDASRDAPELQDTMRVKFQKGLTISSLNLANSNLHNVNAVAGISGLQKLSLANNTIVGNSSLMRLLTLTDIVEINLQGVNLTPEQLSIVLQLSNLKILNVSNNEKLSGMTWNLRSSSNLVKLLLNNCKLQQMNVVALKKTLPKLQEIHINGNNFTCEYLQELLPKMHANGIRAQVKESNKCSWRQ